MTNAKRFKKNEARKAITRAADYIAEYFGIETPEAVNLKDEFPEWWSPWEYETKTVPVWTKAGPAELNVRISPGFAHLYFRFEYPEKAAKAGFDDCFGRLNRASGKWNSIETPSGNLAEWVDGLGVDFERVAERNPDPAEVERHKTEEAERAKQWAQYVAEL